MKRVGALIAFCLLGVGCGTDVPEEGDGRPWTVPTRGPGDGGSDDGDDEGNPDFSLSASPDSFVVPQGGSAEVHVTVSREDGFDEEIVVRIDGLPPGVSATTLELGTTGTTGKIVVSAPATVAVPERTTARVRGYSESGARSDEIKLSVRGEPGSLDTSFGDGGVAAEMLDIEDLDPRSDGTLIFTGWDDAKLACRMHADGAADASFGDGGCVPLAIAGTGARMGLEILSHEGQIVVVGLRDVGPDREHFIARFDNRGDPVSDVVGVNVNPGGDEHAYEVLALGESFLFAGGEGPDSAFLARVDKDGDFDASFGTGGVVRFGDSPALDLTRTSDGRLIALTRTRLFAFTAAGIPDVGFGSGDGITELPYACAAMTRAEADLLLACEGMSLVRVSSGDGAVEASWPALEPPEKTAYPEDIVIADDTTVIGGSIADSDHYLGMGRRNKDGSPDLDFGPNDSATAMYRPGVGHDVEVLSDGRLLLAGTRDLDTGLVLRIWD